ncbi:GGDEF domain-containing response regulator [Paramaledivibacter caminithermalis]|jgi:diguanylate cyclase (GGDEF)-like protein|uniref:Stage 0 sporulation protein A homolog n=1 Tax=Paramaledivibacter caminithermalis (strain DSM 15212 / CIP 107654 / DViRD3) TaxID=1121301 RepID=A0A1M6NPS5_PARC5|nr:diguanylate cyclase [Paramaledivibacter caminithermalis]SHJ97616.1 response regulator receiver modulated diguanylate cyclase [Paramaledivibacter caminithermalis DSM 15212]
MISQDKPNILIVDDRPENILVLESILEGLELNIFKATSGNEALGLMLDYDFALVLLDVQMPVMDGFEVAELMRGSERTRNIPIIFVTAINKDQKCMFKGYEIGAVDYLFKPIEPLILKSKVKVFIELQKQKETLKKQTKLLEEKVDELLRLQKLNYKLEHLSTIDVVTGISNRRSFEATIQTEWQRAIRMNTPLSLIMIDIDHFKAFNDHYGHQAGDKCIRKVAEAISSSIQRPGDFAARYGGEEFVVVLPDTEKAGAIIVAERIRNNVESLEVKHACSGVSPYVTISLGVATLFPEKYNSAEELIRRADRALFQAKYLGRNRIEK